MCFHGLDGGFEIASFEGPRSEFPEAVIHHLGCALVGADWMEKGNGSTGEGLQDDCADQWDRNREPSQTCAQVAFIIRADDAGGLANSLQSDEQAYAFRRQSLDEIRRGRIVSLDVARARMREWAKSILERQPAFVLGQKVLAHQSDRPEHS